MVYRMLSTRSISYTKTVIDVSFSTSTIIFKIYNFVYLHLVLEVLEMRNNKLLVFIKGGKTFIGNGIESIFCYI